MKIMPMRRLGAALIAPALAIAVISAAPAAQAAPNSPEAESAAWLAKVTPSTTHLFRSYYSTGTATESFVDLGLNLDLQAALIKLGDTRVGESVYRAVLAQAGDYVDGQYGPSAGAAAKLATAIQTHDRTAAATVGSRNLITTLEGYVTSNGEARGLATAGKDDYTNSLTQSFAARALSRAGSPNAGPALAYLRLQQCSDGFFRVDMRNTQCTTGTASVDATAFALQALDSAGGVDAKADIAKAVAWLDRTQAADGSFADMGNANSNSTGLAAVALGSHGSAVAAGRAAAWVLGRQLTSGANTGAIALTSADLATARSGGISQLQRDAFVRSTVQASLALDALLRVTRSARLVSAGKTVRIAATRLTPGERVTFTMPGAKTVRSTATSAGRASATIRVPKSSGTRLVTVRGSGAGHVGNIRVKVLSAKLLKPRLKYSSVKRGKSQRISVKGLVAGESVKVGYRGKVVLRSKASARGTFTAHFKVGRSKGTQKVSIVGAPGNRRGLTSFTVR